MNLGLRTDYPEFDLSPNNNWRNLAPRIILLFSPLLLIGCFTDGATRITYDIEAATEQVGHRLIYCFLTSY